MLASDLHVHLDGSLRSGTVAALARAAGVVPAGLSDAEFTRRLRFGPGMSLASCLKRFGVTVGLLQTRRSLTRVAGELVADCYMDGVRHIEVRFCPLLHTREGMKPDRAVEAVIRGLDDGASRATSAGGGTERMSARLVLSVLEGMDASQADALVGLACDFRSEGVVGVDLAGDEGLFEAETYRAAFARARRAGLGVTVHAGETGDASHVLDAVTKLGASRIGHGVAAAESASVTALLARERVAVETCLSSNLHTGAVSSLKEHPLVGLFEAGVPVTLATDNRFFSDTTLSREYELAASEAGAANDVLRSAILTGADAAFLPDDDRARLRALYASSPGPARAGAA